MGGLIDQLARAWQGGPALPSADWQDLLRSPQDAYAVQAGLAERLGWQPSGQPQFWKSGGPDRHSPLSHAPLAPSGVRQAAPNQPVHFGDLKWRHPGAEAEIALRLARDLRREDLTGLRREAAAAWIDAMAVAIELVDSRWQEAGAAPALLRQADCLSHGGLALGAWHPYRPLDWSTQKCELQIHEAAPLRACGSHSLGDPAWGLLDWLQHACHQACPEGQVLPAGSVVTTGAWLVQAGLQAGDRVSARFEGLGQIELRL